MNYQNSTLMLMIGVFVGAILAALFSPLNGPEMRDWIQKESKAGWKKANDGLNRYLES